MSCWPSQYNPFPFLIKEISCDRRLGVLNWWSWAEFVFYWVHKVIVHLFDLFLTRHVLYFATAPITPYFTLLFPSVSAWVVHPTSRYFFICYEAGSESRLLWWLLPGRIRSLISLIHTVIQKNRQIMPQRLNIRVILLFGEYCKAINSTLTMWIVFIQLHLCL